MTESRIGVTEIDYCVEPEEGSLYDAGRALSRLIQVLHPQNGEDATGSSRQVDGMGKGSQLFGNSMDFQEKAFNFWRRAAMTISDLYNPDVGHVILDTKMPDAQIGNEDELIVVESRKTQIAKTISRLNSDELEKVRIDYGYLSNDGIMGKDIKDSMLWKSVPIAASEIDRRMAGHVRLQNDAFIKASKGKISLRPLNPSR